LPADFRRGPSGQHGYEAQRAHHHADTEEPAAVEETAAIAQPPTRRHHCQHQKSNADHDAEGEERDRNRRPVLGFELLQALDLSTEAVGQDEAAEIRYFDRISIGLVGRVGNGEQASGKDRSVSQRASMAASLAG
jgi:hypothetical protein